jgi:hypothetical protein
VLLTSAMVNVDKGPPSALSLLDTVISMFAPTVAKARRDPGFGSVARMMFLVPNFSHLHSPLLAKDVSSLVIRPLTSR